MNYFILYQIALERHNDNLRQAAQARLVRIAQAGQNSENVTKDTTLAKEPLIRNTLRKTSAMLKGLATGLLVLGLGLFLSQSWW